MRRLIFFLPQTGFFLCIIYIYIICSFFSLLNSHIHTPTQISGFNFVLAISYWSIVFVYFLTVFSLGFPLIPQIIRKRVRVWLTCLSYLAMYFLGFYYKNWGSSLKAGGCFVQPFSCLDGMGEWFFGFGIARILELHICFFSPAIILNNMQI